MAKFRCIECETEFEADPNDTSRRCPKCLGRCAVLLEGELKRGKSWSAKTYSVK